MVTTVGRVFLLGLPFSFTWTILVNVGPCTGLLHFRQFFLRVIADHPDRGRDDKFGELNLVDSQTYLT